MAGPRGMMGSAMSRDYAKAKPKDIRKSLKRLFNYFKPHQWAIVLIIVLSIIATIASLFGPFILGSATNEIYYGMINNNTVNIANVVQIIGVLIVIYVLASFIRVIEQFVLVRVAQKIILTIRKDIDAKLHLLPLKYFDTRSYGDLLSVVTNDVDTLANSFNQALGQLLSSLITIVGIIIIMIYINLWLSIVILITVPLSIYITGRVAKSTQSIFANQQKSMGKLNGHIEESLTGHSTIKAYSYETKTINKFDLLNNDLAIFNIKALFASGILFPVTFFVGNIGYVLIAVGGGILALNGLILVGYIQSFILYMRQLNMPLGQLASMLYTIQSGVAAAERIFEVLDETEESDESMLTKQLVNVKGSVDFKNIAFSYNPETPLITNLSFKAEPGQLIAIVGPTGGGKTTLVNLLLRFYELNSGSIEIDGVNIKDIKRTELRKIFGMVLQDTWLFNASIKDNIKYGNPLADDSLVKKAAKDSLIDNFIETLPSGYDYEINSETTNLSQGEKQLLTIARAFLKDPKILILDEATSSVDTRTEMLIQNAMKSLLKNRTSFVIAHRLSTIKNADLILVVDKGNIVESGKHEELLAKKGFYSNLYNAQFNN
jgi:ATP-binding cassette, subfamily B, multidrug efflux pump